MTLVETTSLETEDWRPKSTNINNYETKSVKYNIYIYNIYNIYVNKPILVLDILEVVVPNVLLAEPTKP